MPIFALLALAAFAFAMSRKKDLERPPTVPFPTLPSAPLDLHPSAAPQISWTPATTLATQQTYRFSGSAPDTMIQVPMILTAANIGGALDKSGHWIVLHVWMAGDPMFPIDYLGAVPMHNGYLVEATYMGDPGPASAAYQGLFLQHVAMPTHAASGMNVGRGGGGGGGGGRGGGRGFGRGGYGRNFYGGWGGYGGGEEDYVVPVYEPVYEPVYAEPAYDPYAYDMYTPPAPATSPVQQPPSAPPPAMPTPAPAPPPAQHHPHHPPHHPQHPQMHHRRGGWAKQRYADAGVFRFSGLWDGRSTSADIETQLMNQGWEDVRVYLPHHATPAGWPEPTTPNRWRAEGRWNGRPSRISGVEFFWKKSQ